MIDWLPPHKCGLYLEHNAHKDVYYTVEQHYNPDRFVSMEEWDKAVREDSVWTLQWYPDTPIGFYLIAASSLEAIQQALKENKYE
jgi:hypothetical protein